MKMICCDLLRSVIQDDRIPINYLPRFDEYYVDILGDGNAVQGLFFCPFCGFKFADSRRSLFFDRLRQLGIEYELGDDDLLPEEFQTARWWDK